MIESRAISSVFPPGYLLVVAIFGFIQMTCLAVLKPAALRSEYRVNPQGIDEAPPRLTWQIASGQRGANQTAKTSFIL